MEKKKKHGASIAVVIGITILVILYLCVYFGGFIFLLPNPFLQVLFAVIPIALALGMIFVCVQRIREIQGGEEDDLSKY